MFFNQLASFSGQPACIAEGKAISYQALSSMVEEKAMQLSALAPQGRKLILLQADNDLYTLVIYLAALQASHVLMLVESKLSQDKLEQLIESYQPNLLITGQSIQCLSEKPIIMAEELALLLSTSGSTGSPKQVALSQQNLQANADSICAYLPIKSTGKTITSLPFAYSYGLSVINSHLNAGACIVLNQAPVTAREFWQCFEQEQITSIAGVPHSWQMLLRLGITKKNWPHLSYITQAGGKLDTDTAKQLVDYAQAHNILFYIMYGQTEATARMAYLSPEKVVTKADSIGQAIPGGKLALKSTDGGWIDKANAEGELYYQGQNVMLGYAETQANLAEFKPLEWLATGDLAHRDNDGDFKITGRSKRIIKPFGQRVNLDEVEQKLSTRGYQALCVGNDSQLQVAIVDCENTDALKTELSQWLQLHPSAITVMQVDKVPVNANGKRDYQQLAQMLKQAESAVQEVTQ